MHRIPSIKYQQEFITFVSKYLVMRRFVIYSLLVCTISAPSHGQEFLRRTYYDKNKKDLKEVYQVQDSLSNVLHGRYISYFVNGNVESRGQFRNNETVGVWEFFYETGNLKMRGMLKQNSSFGAWEYFYESGKKSMEGTINGKEREGLWKMYFESGALKEEGEFKKNKHEGLWLYYFEDGTKRGEIDYQDDFGRYTEFSQDGKVIGEGPKRGNAQVGLWRFYDFDGVLQSEGEFDQGKKSGEWKSYHPDGKLLSSGVYKDGLPVGKWVYYYDDGTVSSVGEYNLGIKTGYWNSYSPEGKLKSEIDFKNGSGEFREYHANGAVRLKGNIVNDVREGIWDFYFEDGTVEGHCEYLKGKGNYTGFYANGSVQTKGQMDGDKKVGTWEIYEPDGKLSGYYKPFYDNQKLKDEIIGMTNNRATVSSSTKKNRVRYFDERFNEFRGLIVAGNPVFMFAGRFPIAAEFYMQERLGHEFEFIGIRNPFFKADTDIPVGKAFERGYAMAIRQKFYNRLKAGLWYFGQEVRFTNIGHFTNFSVNQNPDNIFTASSLEQRFQYGVLVGYRIIKRNNAPGFTLDTFIAGDLGYRNFDVDETYSQYFDELNQSKFVASFHFGLNIGHVFSFK